MWDLVHRQGIKPRSPALGAQSLNHWTTREGPIYLLLKQIMEKRYFIIWQLLKQMIQLQGSEWTRFRRQLSCCLRKTLSLLFIQLSVTGGIKSDHILKQILRLSSHLGITGQFKREALVFQFLLKIGVNILSCDKCKAIKIQEMEETSIKLILPSHVCKNLFRSCPKKNFSLKIIHVI